MRLGVCATLLVFACNLSTHGQSSDPRPPGNEKFPNPISDENTVPRPGRTNALPSATPAQALSPGGAIPVSELKIPARALKEIQLSRKLYESGKYRKSAEHLEKALAISPEIAMLHYSLGLCYAQLQHYEKAVVEFQSASGLDPHLVRSVNGLSGSLFHLGRYSEAEAAARHALEIDPDNREAGYLVGRSLAAENQNSMEAVELLRRSRPQFPMAQLILAGVLLKRNARDEAIAELRAYLQQPNAPLRDKASCMLEKLTLPPDKAVCSLN